MHPPTPLLFTQKSPDGAPAFKGAFGRGVNGAASRSAVAQSYKIEYEVVLGATNEAEL